ncbi:hypothetical protein GGF32_005728 [Allomyces javanicus]|nr:hypothetical protein GGF32_005728 [Allomyces javanicus]
MFLSLLPGVESAAHGNQSAAGDGGHEEDAEEDEEWEGDNAEGVESGADDEGNEEPGPTVAQERAATALKVPTVTIAEALQMVQRAWSTVFKL